MWILLFNDYVNQWPFGDIFLYINSNLDRCTSIGLSDFVGGGQEAILTIAMVQ